jgi:Holliday junction DNA helicase RuvB
MHSFKLSFYEPDEMRKIVGRSASILGLSMEEGAGTRVAGCSRSTPRIANRLVRAVRDFSQVKSEDRVTVACVEETLRALDIDHEGLDATDRLLLSTIVQSFAGGPVGLSTLAAMLAEEEETIEDVYEPFLLQQGYLHRTPKGRMATKKAFERLGSVLPEAVQPALL